jgi:uncharacterized protein (TIGR03435 family)
LKRDAWHHTAALRTEAGDFDMWKRHLLSSIAAALIMTCAAKGQATFEVATVKPAAPLDMAKLAAAMRAGEAPKIGPHVENGRAEYTYMSLRDLVALGYNVKPYQVSGPDWMATTRFDIEAKMPEGSAKEDAPAMVQAMLKDRFKLATHPSMEERPVLALVVGKNGPKLKPAEQTPVPIDESTPLHPGEVKMDSVDGPMRMTIHPDGSATVNMGVKGVVTQKMDPVTKTLHIQSSAVTMAGFADMLTRVMQMGGESNRQVVDMTNVKGYYQTDLDLSIAQIIEMAKAGGFDVPARPGGEPVDAGPGDGQTVQESVRAMGLALEGRKASVARLVIDSVMKMPTEN